MEGQRRCCRGDVPVQGSWEDLALTGRPPRTDTWERSGGPSGTGGPQSPPGHSLNPPWVVAGSVGIVGCPPGPRASEGWSWGCPQGSDGHSRRAFPKSRETSCWPQAPTSGNGSRVHPLGPSQTLLLTFSGVPPLGLPSHELFALMGTLLRVPSSPVPAGTSLPTHASALWPSSPQPYSHMKCRTWQV